MAWIQGISVNLVRKVKTAENEVGEPIGTEISEIVENVIVTPASMTEIIDALNLHGRKAVYSLCIPKGDEHDWEDNYVEFFGERFHIFTPTEGYIEEMLPLEWNKKYLVEKYE